MTVSVVGLTTSITGPSKGINWPSIQWAGARKPSSPLAFIQPRVISAEDPIHQQRLQRIFQRMDDGPAQIINHLDVTLAQNRLSILLVGDQTLHTGMARSLDYRWFTDPAERQFGSDAGLGDRVTRSCGRPI